jgi:hypothetical protein
MGFLIRRNPDPISERSRTLAAEIEALQAQIKLLDTQLQEGLPPPCLPAAARPATAPAFGGGAAAEPQFEPVNPPRVGALPEPADRAAHYNNELGVRKYDLAGAWQRLKQHFYGPSASNLKLIRYLAAGSIQGLQPLRYEKRVARNRVLFLTAILLAVLWGLIYVFLWH